MSYEDRGVAELFAQLERASANIAANDQRYLELEKAMNRVLVASGRPGGASEIDDGDERNARELCLVKKAYDEPKDTGAKGEYRPSSSEVAAATSHRKAIKALWRHGDPSRLEPELRKSLTSFSLGSNDFLLPTPISNRIITCIVEPTDVAGYVDNQQISSPSIRFPIDNSRMSEAAWACEASCFANNPQPDLQEGLGELEIKAESLRFVACAGRDLLEDASFNIENWLVRKVEAGFRNSVSATIILGDGVGKPMGILNPRAGVVICETGQATAAGSVTWQDLYMLKWDVPQIWHSNAAFYMNARTFAQISTMSDAAGRPIFSQPPQGELVPTIAGSPVRILTQMPDIAPGSTPVMFGDLRAGYMLVTRSGLSMTPDPYTAGGWCVLFRFSMRVGGAPICPNAVRVLRIR